MKSSSDCPSLLLNILALFVLFCPSGAVGCQSNEFAVQSAVPATDAAAEASDNSTPLEPVGPRIDGWDQSIDGITCHHPPVSALCRDGWCTIPEGCFVMGSPETEYLRGVYGESLGAVTLTHAFEIAQRETTQTQWMDMVGNNPSRADDYLSDCLDPDCPVGHVSWFDAVEFANRLSSKHDPELRPCYVLTGCTGEAGNGFVCTNVTIDAPTIYDCEGFRLPTEAEWEYAARAGTGTAYYSGDVTVAKDGIPDPNLEAIAWYAPNSGAMTHPTSRKAPNQWMLYDMLGNVDEWTHDSPTLRDPPGPFTDPTKFTPVQVDEKMTSRVTKGGRAIDWPYNLRVANWDYPTLTVAGQGCGFRLARTLH